MIWLLPVILLLCDSTALANQISVNEYDYQEDAPEQQQFLPQQVFPVENAPYAYYPNANSKMKAVDDGKRGRRFKLDVLTAIRQLNVSHRTDPTWPDVGIKFGAVAGVSLDKKGNVVIFHRADRVWTDTTFNKLNNTFQERHLGPIPTDTILAIDKKTGQLSHGFGRGLFYMPHGITVDKENNVWVTDVALHQVMKLNREVAGDAPLMVLGTKFQPGSGQNSFCKPTSVAVLPDGDFFVADGYCNARIVKYNRVGDRILEWGKNSFQGHAFSVAPENYFAVPHGLTLALDKGLLCVADRENGRVQCFHHSNGTFHSQYHSPLIGDRIFSVAYAPTNGGQLFVVNGPPLTPSVRLEVKGFVIDMASKNVTAKFPKEGNYTNPHDLVVTEDGSEVYVVEYDPYEVHKLVSTSQRIVPAKPAVVAGEKASSTLRRILIAALVWVLAMLVGGTAWVVMRSRKRGNGLNIIYQPGGKRGGRLAWELFPGKPDLNLGALLDGHRTSGRRHRKPSTSRGKFRQLGQESDDEETEAMLKQDSIDEKSGEELA